MGTCPCGSGDPYDTCCGPYHRGERAAPTAEALMRSRYSAFALRDVPYLLASWHPSTRPASLTLDDHVVWRHLAIIRTERGGPWDFDGVVEFEAHYAEGRARGHLHEVSRFVREDARWYYLDAEPTPRRPRRTI